MSFIGTQRIHKVTLHVPRWGAWKARVQTEAGPVPVGPTVLRIADMVLVGAVLPGQSGDNAPNAWVGIVEGGAAWNTVLPSRPAYQNDSGVRLKTVLADLATDCAALIEHPVDVAIGTHWTRQRRRADGSPRTGRDELAALVRGRVVMAWWVDYAGITHFGDRVGPPILATARVLKRDLDRGRREIGTESPLAFLPGATFEGATIERVIVRETPGDLRVETWTS